MDVTDFNVYLATSMDACWGDGKEPRRRGVVELWEIRAAECKAKR